ncbi:MAG: hypothetical protein GY823_04070 [Flavobacteriaceae bacterium]|nr:hypothetical protein [Flavobacteriaceae bacterium]
MKVHNKQRNGMKVTVYNDSNVDWVVMGGGHTAHRFPCRMFTMKTAWEFYIDIFESTWEFIEY